MSNTPKIIKYLAEYHQIQCKILNTIPTGFGVRGYKARLESNQLIAIKCNLEQKSETFTTEARMLNDLKHLGWPVPEVIVSDQHLLAMQWIETDQTGLTQKNEFECGVKLAHLHNKPQQQFGYAYETPIGPLPQNNQQSSKWHSFFRDNRLIAQAKLAHRNNRLPIEVFRKIETLANNLNSYLPEPDHPSLIHGDLWGGNLLTKNGKLAGFIDPAIYHADKEIELAFITMFHTLGEEFFNGYQSVTYIDHDFFNIRRDIYNLYPTLVHLNLFGQSYLPPILQTLEKLKIR